MRPDRPSNPLAFAAALLAASLSALPASAIDPQRLPPPLPAGSCAPEPQVQLARAAEAVRARLLPAQPPRAEEIAGLQLTDDPRALDILRRALGRKPPRSWARARERHCTEVVCALTAALDSPEAALWLLAIGSGTSAVPSLDQAPWEGSGVESLWRPGELRLVARSMDDLPPALQRLANLVAFRRIPDGQDPFRHANAYSNRGDPALGGKGAIWIRDVVWNMPYLQQREVIAHEVGHQYDYSQSPGEAHAASHSAAWLSASRLELLPDGSVRPSGAPAAAVVWPPLPETEELPNAVASFRYQPRLLRADSAAKYEAVKALYGRDYSRVEPDADVDAAFAAIGDPPGQVRGCAAWIQRGLRAGGDLPSVFLWRWVEGRSQWSTRDVASFVTSSPCFATVMEKLRATAAWKHASCNRDQEELSIAALARLEDAWAQLVQAAQRALAAVPPGLREACLARGDVSLACFAGAEGAEAARREAERLLPAGPAAEQAQLGGLLLRMVPLAPADGELGARFPALTDPRAMLAACLLGTIDISAHPGQDDWRYWVRNPRQGDQVQGFAGPLWTDACDRDWAAVLAAQGVKLPQGDPLWDHFGLLAKTLASPLAGRLHDEVLAKWAEMRAACGIPFAAKADPAQRPCAQRWVAGRIASLVPTEQVDAVAARLAELAHGP